MARLCAVNLQRETPMSHLPQPGASSFGDIAPKFAQLTDEVLFAGGIYPPFDEGSIVWPPSPASVRVPSVLLGRCRSGGGTC